MFLSLLYVDVLNGICGFDKFLIKPLEGSPEKKMLSKNAYIDDNKIKFYCVLVQKSSLEIATNTKYRKITT